MKSHGTGSGDGAHQEPLVKVGSAPGARQGRGEPGRRMIPHLIIKTFKFYVINIHIFICIQYMYTYMLNHFSHVQLFETIWVVAHQAPMSMEFSRQEYWSGLPLPTREDLPDPVIEPMSPALAGGCFTTDAWEVHKGSSFSISVKTLAIV